MSWRNDERLRPSPQVCRFVLIYFLFGCAGGVPRLSAQIPSSDAAAATSIRGTVLNRLTHEPISRALVYSPDNLCAALTDDSGHFEFKFPPAEPEPSEPESLEKSLARAARNYRPQFLMARKPGYLSSIRADGTDGDALEEPVAFSPSEMTLYLHPQGMIVGHLLLGDMGITDHFQVNLFRCSVQGGVEKWELFLFLRTSSSDEFHFHSLPPGTYKLGTGQQMEHEQLISDPGAKHFGYPPVFFPNSTDLATSAPIQLGEGVTFHVSLSPVRKEYYPVKIGVTNVPEGSNVRLFVYPQGHPGAGYSLDYDPMDGTVQSRLPDGNYTVRIDTGGQNGSEGVLNFAVAGAPLEGQTVTLIPNGSLTVHVKKEYSTEATQSGEEATGDREDTDGARPLSERSDIQVQLIPAEEYGAAQERSAHAIPGEGADSLIIENVPPGRYRVQIDSNDGYASSVLWGGTDLLRMPLVIGIGGTRIPIEITVRNDGAEVTGTVQVSANGLNSTRTSQPSSPFVYFLPVGEKTGQFTERPVEPDGTFDQEQLPPGTYSVLAVDHQEEELEYASDEVLSRYESKGQVIRFSAGQKAHLQLTLTPMSARE